MEHVVKESSKKETLVLTAMVLVPTRQSAYCHLKLECREKLVAARVNSLAAVHLQVPEAELSFFLFLYLPRPQSEDSLLGKKVDALERLVLGRCCPPAVWLL